MPLGDCRFCFKPCEVKDLGNDRKRPRDSVEYSCLRCGDYEASDKTAGASPRDKPLFVGALRHHRDNGGAPVVVDDLEAASKLLFSEVPPPSDLLDRLDAVLLHASSHTDPISFCHPVNATTDYPIGFAVNEEAYMNLVAQLVEEGLGRWPAAGRGHLQVTKAGVERVRELRSRSRSSEQVFVAMAFRDDLDLAYDNGIKPAILECAYTPMRVDRVHQEDMIDDFINAQVVRSRLVIADFTYQRPGVYHEAGLALGRDIPVIRTCRSDEMKNLHFDTRQYPHLEWETPEQLKGLIKDRIDFLYRRKPPTFA